MTRRILVTGGGGLLGNAVGESLGALIPDVDVTGRSIDRKPTRLQYFQCELCQSRAVMELVERGRYDVVIHAAGRIRSEGNGFSEFVCDNVLSTANLIAAARRFGVRRFIFISSVSVYSGSGPFVETSSTDPRDIYGWSKRKAEEICLLQQDEFTQVTVLRLGGLHGLPRRSGVVYNFVMSATRGEAIVVDEPETILSFAFLDDVCSLLSSLVISEATPPSKVYNIASDSLRLLELAKEVRSRIPSSGEISPVRGTRIRNRAMVSDLAQKEIGFRPLSLGANLDQLIARTTDYRD